MIRDWEILSREPVEDFKLFQIHKNRCAVSGRVRSERPRPSIVQPQHLDSGEDIGILKIPLKEIPAKIGNREIDHGKGLLSFLSISIIAHHFGSKS